MNNEYLYKRLDEAIERGEISEQEAREQLREAELEEEDREREENIQD